MIELILPTPNFEFRPDLAAIVNLLKEQNQTIGMLSQTLDRPKAVIQHYVKTLEKQQIVFRHLPQELLNLNAAA